MQKGWEAVLLVAAGAFIGGMAAALATPISGKHARRMIRKKVSRGTVELQKSTRRVRDQLANVAAMAR